MGEARPWRTVPEGGTALGPVRRRAGDGRSKEGQKKQEHWACPSGAPAGSRQVLWAPGTVGKMKLLPHLGGRKDEGE